MKALNIYEQKGLYKTTNVLWHWITLKSADGIDWETISTIQTPWVNRIQKPYLARYLMALRAAIKARNCRLVVTHGELSGLWVGVFMRLLNIDVLHLAWAFTMPEYDSYSPIRKWLLRYGLKNVDRFVMFTECEKRSYPELLNQDPDRFRMGQWGADGVDYDHSKAPIVTGEYFAAVGGEGRDYSTLFESMKLFPESRLVVVGSPESVSGLEVPDNIIVYTNIPYGDAMNIIANAKFMVLPLKPAAPCGHGSIISQFYLEKATIVTNSEVMEGYAYPEENVLDYPVQDVDQLSKQINRLLNDEVLRNKIAANGLGFAKEFCSEKGTINYFNCYLEESGLIPERAST